ncbi:hypothetical protein B9Z19DRAFT_970635 [Tuber borchii]|uniref:Uncharacterized protein n=1 Tax=Tuber borchii TaxID=42251 RepID=A0A2T7A242_TUBBO|nr:hypothetical protein B9Z19DRAFT_970635 [Tuber borchii]
METLYNELWGKPLGKVIEDRSFTVYEPQYCFSPGYKVDLYATGHDAFPIPEANIVESNRVFKVLKTVSKLPCGMNRLLVRSEFLDAERELVEVESEKWTDVDSETGIPASDMNLDYNIGGQPGSGKQYFFDYLLVRRISASQATAVRINDSECYLFNANSHGRKTDASTLFALPDKEKRMLWILTGECIDDARWYNNGHGWFVVLAASPAKVTASRQWVKERNPGVWYMKNWQWDEIVAAFRFTVEKGPGRITLEQLLMLYTIFTSFGPIGRTCLKTISMRNESRYNQAISRYIGDVDNEIKTFIQTGGFQMEGNGVDQHASHRISIMEPENDRQSYKSQITTRWIAHRVFEQVQKKSKLKCFELYQWLSAKDELRSAAGWFFEGYAHEWLCKGGSFIANKLPIGDHQTSCLEFLTSSSTGLSYFRNTKDLALKVHKQNGHGIEEDVIGKYFVPENANFESVDGLVFTALDTVILFQITIAKSHNIKFNGLKRIWDSIPLTIKNIQIVFVIPDNLIRNYAKLQNVPEASDIRPKASHFTISQYRLVLTDQKIQSMALVGPFKEPVSGGGGDRSGGGADYRGDTLMSGT